MTYAAALQTAAYRARDTGTPIFITRPVLAGQGAWEAFTLSEWSARVTPDEAKWADGGIVWPDRLPADLEAVDWEGLARTGPGGRDGRGRAVSDFATRLHEARDRAGLSLSELARQAEVSKAHLCNLEGGSRGALYGIGTEILVRLCRVLGVSADWLVGLDPVSPWEGTGAETTARLTAENARLRHVVRRVRESLEEVD